MCFWAMNRSVTCYFTIDNVVSSVYLSTGEDKVDEVGGNLGGWEFVKESNILQRIFI